MSAAEAAVTRPKASNTARANKRLIELVVAKEGSFFEKIAFLNSMLREELRDLNETTIKDRLKARGQQIMTQVLGLGATGYPPKPRKALIPMPPPEELRALPAEFLLFLPPDLLPEELRPVTSGRSYTRKKSLSPNANTNGLGPPHKLIHYAPNQVNHAEEDRKLTEAFGSNITRVAPFIGAVCDPIGFQQHRGECATDSLQQLLLFADQWKAKTQPMVYTMTQKIYNEIYTRYYKRASDRPFPGKVMLEFFRILQMRFRNHYAMIGTTKYAVNNECVEPFMYRRYVKALHRENTGLTGALATRKRRLSANLGIGAKNSLRSLLGTRDSNPVGTSRTADMVSYFRGIWEFCGLHEYSSLYRVRHAPVATYHHLFPNYNHVAFYLGSEKINPSSPITYKGLDREGNVGHATAIYMCDGKWVYYDNNRGVMDIAQPLMDDILNEVDPFYIFWAYQPGTHNILFFKAPFVSEEDEELFEGMGEEEERIMAENDGDSSRRPLFMWKKDRWEKVDYSVITDLATDEVTKKGASIYSFKRVIHIVTRDRSVSGYPGTHFIDDQRSAPAFVFAAAEPVALREARMAAISATTAPGAAFNWNAFYKLYETPAPAPAFAPPAPLPPVPINSLAGPRKALENALGNAKNRGQKRVNNTTRALKRRIRNLGLNRQKNVNNTTRALEKRILELASGSATRNR